MASLLHADDDDGDDDGDDDDGGDYDGIAAIVAGTDDATAEDDDDGDDGDELEEEEEEEDEEEDDDEEEEQTAEEHGAYKKGNVVSLDRVPELKEEREVGSLASWTLSSSKVGSGVTQLRDDDLATFWQSDGHQPHYINLQFPKRMHFTFLCMYVDLTHDESYTPQKIQLRAGSSFHDLQDVGETIELKDPRGWQVFPLVFPSNKPVRVHLFQIMIIANHQNGRDTHIRQVKIYSPRTNLMDPGMPAFSTHQFNMYSIVR